MSVKIERLNSIFVKEISYILSTEVKDEDIKFVTIKVMLKYILQF